uniref:Protein kinase domain-containing protein n=1 Tax=Macrostomum lignano TaxID=282301 RepID=A0A1I8H7U3_9PLAT
ADSNNWLYGWSEELPVIPGLTPSPHLVTKTAYSEGEHWVRGAQIGLGAFATCYQARDKRTGVLMAVKEISLVRNCDQEQHEVIEAVQEEVELMTRLRHQNLVRILGATMTRDRFCMFVEWMPGGSVSALLNRFGPFSEPVISSYIQQAIPTSQAGFRPFFIPRQVLRGLAYLHNQQILHRDLKGANLLVSSSGRQVRIADFGAAGRLASHMTGAGEFKGQLLGTIAFMAPEVLRGENYGRSCDIWSVGCVIIEMVTTKPPWDMPDLSNHLALIYHIASSSDPPPLPDNMHPGLRDVLLRCVDPIPFNRPSAKELLQHPLFTHYPALTARPEGRRV